MLKRTKLSQRFVITRIVKDAELDNESDIAFRWYLTKYKNCLFLVFVWSDSGGTSQYIPMIYLTIT